MVCSCLQSASSCWCRYWNLLCLVKEIEPSPITKPRLNWLLPVNLKALSGLVWHVQWRARCFCRPCSIYTSAGLQAHEPKAPGLSRGGVRFWAAPRGRLWCYSPALSASVFSRSWIFMCIHHTTPHSIFILEVCNLCMFGSAIAVK